MNVFDASALLAYLQGEAGSDVVRECLERGGVCSAANWSEISQKVISAEADWALARSLLLSFDLTVEPVTRGDAEAAAKLWRKDEGLSLADRLCLALAARLDATAVTAGRQWQGRAGVLVIR